MTQEITVQEDRGLFAAQTPNMMVERATEIANCLVDVIDKQELFTDFRGKKYVRVEGWQSLGSMLAILPKESVVTRHDDGSYEAHVDLINVKTGLTVGAGSGFCGVDEPNWKSKPNYARRSMAITRATGKAYRLAFGWIMCLAGYEPTPAEEMPQADSAIDKVNEMIKAKSLPPQKETKPIVYTGTNEQKYELQKVFDEIDVTDPDVMRKLHQELIDEKCELGNVFLTVKEKLGLLF